MRLSFSFVLTVIILGVQPIVAQTYFSKTYDKDSMFQFSGNIVKLQNGELFSESSSERKGSNLRGKIFLVVDTTGAVVRSSYLEFAGHHVSSASISSASQNGIFYNTGFMSDAITGNFDAFVVKHDQHGDTIWKNIIDSATEAGFDVLLTHNDQFYITGAIDFDDGIQFNSDIFLSKFDSSGHCLWTTYYGGKDDDRGLSLVKDKNTIYIGGNTNSPSKGDNYDTYLSKVSLAGDLEWEKIYGSDGGDGGVNFLVMDKNKDLVFASTLDTTLNFMEYSTRYIAKTDTMGNIKWRRFFSRGYLLEIWNIIVTPEDEILLCGFEAPNKDFGWIAKLTPGGNILWERRYQTRKEKHPLVEHYITDMVLLDNGDIMSLGTAPSITDTNRYDRDIWVMRLDEKGCLYPGCDSLDVPVVDTPDFPEYIVYPNPARSVTKIALEGPLKKDMEIEIINLMGQRVREITAKKGWIDIPIDVSTLGSGLYLIRIIYEDAVIDVQRLVKVE
ncbi:MAG: T9SS type A sorting domain-containing protein [Chitinophagales bacterium]|nr:T9SS type A sorting domain-containing protein [Chitinophagales bacterium]